MAKLLDKRLSRLKELIEQQQVMDPSDPPPAKLEISEINVEHSITKAMCDKIKRMQFSDEKETSLEIIGTRGMDGTDIGSGIDRTPAHLSLQQNNKDSFQSSATLTLSLGRNTRSGRKIFEHIPLPSLHSVLMGSQYGKALEDGKTVILDVLEGHKLLVSVNDLIELLYGTAVPMILLISNIPFTFHF